MLVCNQSRDVITVMRSLGTYPTKKEIESHFKTYDKKHGDDIEFSTFLNIMYVVKKLSF